MRKVKLLHLSFDILHLNILHQDITEIWLLCMQRSTLIRIRKDRDYEDIYSWWSSWFSDE